MSTTKTIQVSVVLPAYNEVEYLQPAVERTIQTLNRFTQSYEVIIAEAATSNAPKTSQKKQLELGIFTATSVWEEELHSTTRSSKVAAKFWFTWIWI